ncbi:MAG: DNA/RNA helicase domain-containing protein [Microbacteriaceae bacterium]
MTDFKIETFPFAKGKFPDGPEELMDWPVMYVLTGQKFAYVGETHSAVSRIGQHLSVDERRRNLNTARVIIDPRFNKSACHDLEAFLIKYMDGDERFEVLNRNGGQTSYSYYDQATYRDQHEEIFAALEREGLFSGSIRDIENSDLFKFSPFKELTLEQRAAVVNVTAGLLEDLREGKPSMSIIEGGPGTGKTVVVITLLKLLKDVQAVAEGEDLLEEEVEGMYSDFYLAGNREVLAGRRVGFVIPQQALRTTLKRVFKRSPVLRDVEILTPWEVGKSETRWDILVVDEAHRLSQYAAQSFGGLVADFRTITERLLGTFDKDATQLDWIRAQSDHQVVIVDGGQAVLPADLPETFIEQLGIEAQNEGRRYQLHSQLRVQAGGDYVDYIRDVLRGEAVTPKRFANYDLRFYEDPAEMHDAIRERDAELGLARLVAGFAWPHVSKKDTHADVRDITIGDYEVQWNRKMTDWVLSPGSLDEAGSIYTIQGYDLNIAGVIIGPDLVYRDGRIQLDSANYFDPRGNQRNNNLRGVTYDDADIQHLVENIYRVLLTRGIKGTYVHVVDPALREHLRPYFS